MPGLKVTEYCPNILGVKAAAIDVANWLKSVDAVDRLITVIAGGFKG